MKLNVFAACGAVILCAGTGARAQTQTTAAPPAPAQVTTQVEATPAIPLAVQKPVEVTNGTVLPSNTDVWLSLDSELSSKKARLGDPIAMKVSRDVMMGQYVVIPRGTEGKGHVSYRTGKGAFGKSAKMEFDLDAILLNGRSIPIGGHYRIEGQGNTGATVAAVATVWIASPFITGHSAVAAQGSEWKASTKEPIAIQIGS
jgi:hypothetical protein